MTVDDLTGLLMRARDGDRVALATFIRQTQPTIWRFCAHLAGRDNADDATQETFLAAWQALPFFRGDATARTWLFVIARRCIERVVVRQRRWVELSGYLSRPERVSDPAEAVELSELMAGLDFDRRLALELTQIIGLSYAEAAEVCECPIGTIRSRVARAREQLLESQSRKGVWTGPSARQRGRSRRQAG